MNLRDQLHLEFTSQQRKIVDGFMEEVPRAEFIKELAIAELPDVDHERARPPDRPMTAAHLSEPSLPLIHSKFLRYVLVPLRSSSLVKGPAD